VADPLVTLDLDRIVNGLHAYAWPFLRVTGLMLTAPVLGARLVPRRVKMVLAIALTLAIAPAVPAAPRIEPFSAFALLTAAQQLLIGVAIGFCVQVTFDALQLAGQAISMTMGLGFATLIDPSRGEQNTVVGQFFVILGLLIYLSLGVHWVVIGVLADSFRTMPPGTDGLGSEGLAVLVAWGGKIFEAGILIALPAVVGLLVVNLALGVVSRAAPQLNLFAVGFPVSMAVGFLMLILTLPSLRAGFERLLLEAVGTATSVVGGP
jgi:flagellar biosynthetic protein FliR